MFKHFRGGRREKKDGKGRRGEKKSLLIVYVAIRDGWPVEIITQPATSVVNWVFLET